MLDFIMIIANTEWIPPLYSYFILSVYVILFYQLFRTGRVFVNGIIHKEFWLLAISGFILARSFRFYLDYSSITLLVLYCLNPVMIFLAGYVISNCSIENQEGRIRSTIHCIAIGCAIHIFLNIIANIGRDRWNTVDVFSSFKTVSATNLGAVNTFVLALLPYIVMTKKKKVKVTGSIFIAMSIIYVFILGTRTQLYLTGIVAVVTAVIYLINRYKGSFPVKVLFRWIVSTILILVIATAIYNNNILGIRSKIQQSNLILRFADLGTSMSDSYRMNLFNEGITSLFKYPFGGNHSVSYFHNYWLDVGRVGGWLPTICIILLDVSLFLHIIRIIKKREVSDEIKYIFFGLYLGFMLNFFMEPVMDGYTGVFYRFCLLAGMSEGLYHAALHIPMKKIKVHREWKRVPQREYSRQE